VWAQRFAAVMSLVFAVACAPPDSDPSPSPSPADTPTDSGAARTRLERLKVAPEGAGDRYDRDEFPHWSAHEDGCDTRELVLKRAGEDVESTDDCYPRSGRWTSPYDGETWTEASDIDIDHMVPLAEAWHSGADEWTRDEREKFANDLDNPQLWAVTDNVNQQKSDKDPAEWKPPRREFWCTYAGAWVEVKHVYRLTVDAAEKKALTWMLDRC
jgi:hypothetical protein